MCVEVEVSIDEDDEPEVELTGDPGAPLDVSRVPVIVSVSQVGAGRNNPQVATGPAGNAVTLACLAVTVRSLGSSS